MVKVLRRFAALALLTLSGSAMAQTAKTDRTDPAQLRLWQSAANSGSDRSDFRDASGRSTGSATRSG
ncbi:MAG: hypothetical protein ACK6AO_01055, partial [Planctomycetota bacterium]